MLVAAARADDKLPTMPVPVKLEDIVYKGFVGKALDAVPMDQEHRLALQRTNAVVSNAIAGRSLSVWAGLTNPILLIGGLAWGLFAAWNIKPEAPAAADVPTRGAPTATLLQPPPLDPTLSDAAQAVKASAPAPY